jgi:hypothetical protein
MSITVESPTATEDICMGFTAVAITITHVYGVIAGTGTPTLTIDPYHNTSRNGGGGATDILNVATAVTSITTVTDLTTFNDATIPANSFIVLKTTAMTTVTQATITIKYTVD